MKYRTFAVSGRVGRVKRRREAMRRKLREANRGSLRPRAIPNAFSINHREGPLVIAQFAKGATRLPSQLRRSTRDMSQSLEPSPFVNTYAPLPSVISLGISTVAGH